MARCPRCDGEVEQLHPIPTEALASHAGEESNDGTRRDRPEACRWCLNEISEG